MPLTSRKKRPLSRTKNLLRDAKLIVIATEGEKTEPSYFDLFESLKLKILVLPCEDSKSSPEYVLGRLDQFVEEYQLAEEDQLWLMIDTDRWGQAKLAQVCKECVQKDFRLAVSNPCFELWLYLHIADVVPPAPSTCKEFKKAIRGILGSYNPSNLDPKSFKDHVNEAVKRAKRLDSGDRYPTSLGTHVYKVVEEILT